MKLDQALLKAVQNTSEGVTLTDPNQPDNPLIYVNDAFCHMTGYSKQEVLGKNCRFLQGQETAPDMVRQISNALKKAKSGVFEIYNYKKNGETFWNRLALVPLYDDEKLMYFAGIQADITQLRQSDVALNKHKAELNKIIELTNNDMLALIHKIEAHCDDPEFVKKSCSQLASQASLIVTMMQHNSADILEFVRRS